MYKHLNNSLSPKLNSRDRPRITSEGTVEYDSMLMPPLPEWDGDPRPQEGTSFIEEGLLPRQESAAAAFEIDSEQTSLFL